MKPGNAIEVKNVRKKFKVFFDKGSQLKERILFKNRNRYRLIPSHLKFDYLPDNHRKLDPLIWYPLSFFVKCVFKNSFGRRSRLLVK